MKTKILGILALLCSLHAVAQLPQQPVKIWDKSFGGSSSDSFRGMIQTTDGGYMMIGHSQSTNGQLQGQPNASSLAPDIMLCKTDSNGTLQWVKKYGMNVCIEPSNILQTPDGGYVFGACGGVGLPGYHDPNTVAPGYGDGGDVWVVKTDSSGTVQWQKALGGTNFDAPTLLTLQTDSTIRVFSTTRSSDGDIGGTNAWQPLVYLNFRMWRFDLKISSGYPSNKKIVKAYYEGAFEDIGSLDKIFYQHNKRIVTMGRGLTSRWRSYSENMDTLVNIAFLGSLNGLGEAPYYDFMRTDSGAYVAAHASNARINDTSSTYHTQGPYAAYYDACISKIDSVGSIIWNRCYGFYKTQDAAHSIKEAPDGNYLVVGTGSVREDTTMNIDKHDLKVFKISPAGNLIWEYYIGDFAADDVGMSSVMLPNGDLVIAGYSSSGANTRTAPIYGSTDGWLLKLRTFSEKIVPGVGTETTTNPNLWAVTPIANNRYQVRFLGQNLKYPIALTITDATGQTIQKLSATSSETIIDLSQYAQGIYFLSSPLGAAKMVR